MGFAQLLLPTGPFRAVRGILTALVLGAAVVAIIGSVLKILAAVFLFALSLAFLAFILSIPVLVVSCLIFGTERVLVSVAVALFIWGKAVLRTLVDFGFLLAHLITEPGNPAAHLLHFGERAFDNFSDALYEHLTAWIVRGVHRHHHR